MTRDSTVITDARVAADELLGRYFRIPVHKVMDLSSPRGFDRAVAQLAALLHTRTADSDTAAVRAVVSRLDVDWSATSPTQRRTLIDRALEAAGKRTRRIPRSIQTVFGEAANDVVAATRNDGRRRQGLTISAEFNALDRRIITHLMSSQANFVHDEYGHRHQAFSNEARRIVAEGLESGLGRDDIARDLERAAQTVIAGRSKFYWEVLAGSFVSRGRSFAQLSAYAEASVERYIIEAVLDERTTNICRFLHGKSFSVSRGLQTFKRVEANPDGIKELSPWVREASSADSGRKALYIERGTERVAITEMTHSATGTRDERGTFERSVTTRQLMNLGVSFPPYHGLCRSTTVADVQ